MDLSIDNYPSTRVVKPVWSSSHKFSQSAQLNMWPIRQQSHSKRFYGNSKLRTVGNVSHQTPSFTGGAQDNFPMSIKFDIETFDKHKSYTSMAFCSTSKVKYMPLAGSSLDSFGGLKLGTPHPTIFPTLSRPVSRPVLIHGKRYTVATSEPIRSNTALSQSDHDDSSIFRQDQMIADQRRRFNEIEQHKSHIRYRGTASEGNDFPTRKNYCLSGRRIRIMESKVPLCERVPRLQPTLNINNHTESLDKHQEENSIEALSESASDLEGKQISQYDNAHSVITIDIVDKIDKPTQLNAQETLQSIKKSILYCKTFSLDEQALDQSKEWVNSFVSEIHSEYLLSDSDSNDISYKVDLDSFWTFIQQAQDNVEISNSQELMLIQELSDLKNLLPDPDAFPIDVSTFINLFSAQELSVTRSFWSKVLQDLQIEYLTESSLRSLLLTKINIHPRNFETKRNEENLAITKLYFWIHLMKMLSMKPDINLEDWIKLFVIILINKFAISENLENKFLEKIEMFISIHFAGSQSSLNLSDYLLSIPWMLEVHAKLFGRPFSMEEIAMIRCMI